MCRGTDGVTQSCATEVIWAAESRPPRPGRIVKIWPKGRSLSLPPPWVVHGPAWSPSPCLFLPLSLPCSAFCHQTVRSLYASLARILCLLLYLHFSVFTIICSPPCEESNIWTVVYKCVLKIHTNTPMVFLINEVAKINVITNLCLHLIKVSLLTCSRAALDWKLEWTLMQAGVASMLFMLLPSAGILRLSQQRESMATSGMNNPTETAFPLKLNPWKTKQVLILQMPDTGKEALWR